MKRLFLFILATLAILALIGAVLGPALVDRVIYPSSPFDRDAAPPAPDYDNEANWAALPGREDGADQVPGAPGIADRQATAEVDVFYIHPTSYLVGTGWNAAADDLLSRLLLQNGTLPQQAGTFNGVARVYAPHYRQVSQGAQVREGIPHDEALALAYSDVQRAFDYFLDNYNGKRPFFISSHSQGTTHSVPLVNYLFEERPDDARRLIAAYLIGNTVVAEKLPEGLPVCESAQQTGCVISWNAILEGGDDSHWQSKGRPVCVNPLSWERDGGAVGAQHNLGGIPITGPHADEAPHPMLVAARCGEGILWISEPQAPGYTLALFPGGGYHAYDYNLFYMNLRDNIRQRAAAFRPPSGPELPARRALP